MLTSVIRSIAALYFIRGFRMKVVGQGGLKGAGIEAASVFLLGERAVVLSAKLMELILALCHLPWSCYHGPLVVCKSLIQNGKLQTPHQITARRPQPAGGDAARPWRSPMGLPCTSWAGLEGSCSERFRVYRVKGTCFQTATLAFGHRRHSKDPSSMKP